METSNSAEQPNDLFGYIGSQAFQAATDDEALVTPESVAAPVEQATDVSTTDAAPVASTDPAAPEATPPQPAVGDDEAIRVARQRIQELERRSDNDRKAIALLAMQATQRETKLFEESLKFMSDDEAEAAKQARANEQLQNDNMYYRGLYEARINREAATQEQLDKTMVAQTLIQRLGLPGDNNDVVQALMGSATPEAMLASARHLSSVFRINQQAAAQATAVRTAQAGIHVAGGESAPAVAQKTAPLRSGELIDMMRERQYESAQ